MAAVTDERVSRKEWRRRALRAELECRVYATNARHLNDRIDQLQAALSGTGESKAEYERQRCSRCGEPLPVPWRRLPKGAVCGHCFNAVARESGEP